ncbi:MAG: type II secretion system protein [Candidatus Paceibacterota bacterium]|jgi:prepilin-type N-terminal cleavage/methylation domain-containing protein
MSLKKAFTLIELLIVITIIGILSGLIVVSLNRATASANDAKTKAGVDAIRKTILAYGIHSGGTYPAENCVITSSSCPALTSALVPDYYSALPDTSYSYTSSGTDFIVSGTLSNSDTYSYSSLTGFKTAATLVCPSVGGIWTDTGLGFCVMTYEAMYVSSLPISQSTASFLSHEIGAASEGEGYCNSLNCGGTGCHILTATQKTAILNEVSSVAINWTGGSVNSGNLAKGWDFLTYYTNPPSTTSACLYYNAGNTCGATGTVDQRRTLYFSNGNLIWDFNSGGTLELYGFNQESQFAYWLLQQNIKYNFVPTAEAAFGAETYRCSY